MSHSEFETKCARHLRAWFQNYSSLYDATQHWRRIAREIGLSEDGIRNDISALAMKMKAEFLHDYHDGSHFFTGRNNSERLLQDYARSVIRYLLQHRTLHVMSFHITLPMPNEVRSLFPNRPYRLFLERFNLDFAIDGRDNVSLTPYSISKFGPVSAVPPSVSATAPTVPVAVRASVPVNASSVLAPTHSSAPNASVSARAPAPVAPVSASVPAPAPVLSSAPAAPVPAPVPTTAPVSASITFVATDGRTCSLSSEVCSFVYRMENNFKVQKRSIDVESITYKMAAMSNCTKLGNLRVGAIDLEGDLRRKDIQLIQISFSDSLSLVLDSASEVLESALTAAYTHCDIILIHDFHADACAMDSKLSSLLNKYGNKFLDTQLVLEYFTGNPFGGFNAYLEYMQCSELHDDKKLMHSKMQHNPKFWTERPLPDDRIVYAAKDVLLLQKSVPRLAELIAKDNSSHLLQDLMDATKLRAVRSIALSGRRSMAFNSAKNYNMVSDESHVWLSRGDQIARRVFQSQFEMFCDLPSILNLLPAQFLAEYTEEILVAHYEDKICEFVLDLGKRPYFRQFSTERTFMLRNPQQLVTGEHLKGVESKLCRGFGRDNRAGVDGQLHRISAIKNKNDEVIGVTMRVGRFFSGNTYVLSDLLLHTDYAEHSILVVGPPGSGKTTLIREMARILAEKESVCVVDTSNEICGDGNVTHSCVGLARRLMVKNVDNQHEVMIECVQNHTPTVMIIDEIGRPKEVHAARTCKARGVRMIASAHGDFRGLISNNELRDLVGGLRQVTYGDEEAKKKGCPKVCTERAAPPVFDIVIEVQKGKYDVFTVIKDVGRAVDNALQQKPVQAQLRTRCSDGHGTYSSHAQTLLFEFINLKD